MTEEQKTVYSEIAKEVYNATDSLNRALLPMLQDTPEAKRAYNEFADERKMVSAACYNLANRIIETILKEDDTDKLKEVS